MNEDDKDDVMMKQVVNAHKTGIATMTPREWKWRGVIVKLASEDKDVGRQFLNALRELGFEGFDATEGFNESFAGFNESFAELMGVQSHIVYRWISNNKVPRYALAYIELARVLKAAQRPDAQPAATEAPTAAQPAGSAPPLGDASSLLPQMPLPPHLQKN